MANKITYIGTAGLTSAQIMFIIPSELLSTIISNYNMPSLLLPLLVTIVHVKKAKVTVPESHHKQSRHSVSSC